MNLQLKKCRWLSAVPPAGCVCVWWCGCVGVGLCVNWFLVALFHYLIGKRVSTPNSKVEFHHVSRVEGKTLYYLKNYIYIIFILVCACVCVCVCGHFSLHIHHLRGHTHHMFPHATVTMTHSCWRRSSCSSSQSLSMWAHPGCRGGDVYWVRKYLLPPSPVVRYFLCNTRSNLVVNT